jgi:hypothetical protein
VKTDWGYFSTEVIKETNGHLSGGVDSGDADNDGSEELVIATWSHEIFIIEYNTEKDVWDSWICFVDELDLLEVHIADVDPNLPGNELLTGGYGKWLYQIHVSGKEVTNKSIFYLDTDIWSIQAGDLIPGIPGNEIAVAHWKDFISILYKEGGGWKRYNLSVMGAVSTLEIGEFDSQHPGVELVTGSEEGHVEEFYWENGSFKNRLMFKENRAIRNLDIGDFISFLPGNEIISVSFSMNAGNATMVHGSGDDWEGAPLYNSSRGLEALAVGEVNPEHDGVEAVFAGYANTVNMVIDDGVSSIDAPIVWKGNLSLQSELSGVAIGDIYPLHPGEEAFVVGYNGKVRMITYDYPGSILDYGLSTDSLSIQKGADVTLNTKVTSKGGFEGDLDVTTQIRSKDPYTGKFVNDPNHNITISLENSLVNIKEGPPTSLDITIVTENNSKTGSHILYVTLSSPTDKSVSDTYSLPISVFEFDPAFALTVIPQSANVSKSKNFNTASYQITIFSKTGAIQQTVSLSLSGLPEGATHEFSPPEITSTEESILTITIGEGTKTGKYDLTIVGTDGEHTAVTEVGLNIVELVGEIEIIDVTAEKSDGEYLITSNIQNQGNLPLSGFKLVFYIDDQPVYSEKVTKLDPGSKTEISFKKDLPEGEHRVSVYIEELPPNVDVDGQGKTITIGKDEEDGVSSAAIVVIVIVIIIILIIAAVAAFVFLKSRGKDQENAPPTESKTRKSPRGEKNGEVKFQRVSRGSARSSRRGSTRGPKKD